jgi:hypothetical protein
MPRARLIKAGGTGQEWHSEALPRYARMTKQVEALIAGAYLSGTDTCRVRRVLGALFGGAVSKDTVSRTWRKVQADCEAWGRRSLAEEDAVRLIPRIKSRAGSGWHGGEGAARPQGNVDLVACGVGHSVRQKVRNMGERGCLAKSTR